LITATHCLCRRLFHSECEHHNKPFPNLNLSALAAFQIPLPPAGGAAGRLWRRSRATRKSSTSHRAVLDLPPPTSPSTPMADGRTWRGLSRDEGYVSLDSQVKALPGQPRLIRAIKIANVGVLLSLCRQTRRAICQRISVTSILTCGQAAPWYRGYNVQLFLLV